MNLEAGITLLFFMVIIFFVALVAAARTPIRRGESRAAVFVKMGSKRVLAESVGRAYSLLRQGRFAPVAAVSAGDSQGLRIEEGIQTHDALRGQAALVKMDNGRILRGRYPFSYQRLDEPRLRRLRERFDLDRVVEAGKTDFQRALLMADWVRARFRYGPPRRPVSTAEGAWEILVRGRAGETFLCAHACLAFVQCLLSLGVQGRLLNIAADHSHAHVVTEVWDDDLLKWVLFDVDNSLHYLRDGVPLNALDLHRAWLGGAWEAVTPVFGKSLPMKVPDIEPHNKIPYYAFFAVKMRNDWLSARYPPWHPQGSCVFADLEWVDDRTPGRVDRAVRTRREEDLYWTLHQTEIRLLSVRDTGAGLALELFFEHSTPGLRGFEVAAQGAASRTDQPRFLWPLAPGPNRLSVFTLDELNRPGIPSRVNLHMT